MYLIELRYDYPALTFHFKYCSLKDFCKMIKNEHRIIVDFHKFDENPVGTPIHDVNIANNCS